MTRQSSLFDFEETPETIIERIQERAEEAIDSREVARMFIPASRLYDAERRERVAYDWPTETEEVGGGSP